MRLCNVRLLFFFLLCLLVGHTLTCHSQEGTMPESRELVYLQTDKGIYETGEDLWFKIYVMDAQSLALSERSKTLFVEMLNAKDSIVWQEKYPVLSGIAEGHMYIDKDLKEGDYRIHAYTRFSFLNDTLRPVYPKKIRVVKSIAYKGTDSPQDEDRPVVRLSFFPESGDLIDGIPTKVAFKAQDAKGMPAKVAGRLQENGKEIARLETVHDGMGFVFILPRKTSSYKVVLSDGQEFSFAEVADSGLSIYLRKQTDEYLEFHLCQPKEAAPQKIRLTGRMRGKLYCMAEGTLRDILRIKIPVKEFPLQGIAEFTLYNENGQPMAERLVYVHPERKLHIELNTDSVRYFTRGKGKLNVKVTDEAGNPVQAHLGLSIFDGAYQNELNPENMLSYCYLSTEIKGNIHNPAYYFDDNNKDRLSALDLLLLTQGWRRYVWEKADTAMLADCFLSDEIRGRQIIGKKKKRKELGNGEQLLQVSGPNAENRFVLIDSLGKFVVPTDLMLGLRGGYVYLKPMLDKDEYKPSVIVEETFGKADSLRKSCLSYFPYMNPSQVLSELQLDYPIISQDSSILLSEITVTGKKGRVFRDKMMGRLDSLAQMTLGVSWICGCKSDCGTFLNDYKGYSHHPIGCPGAPPKKKAPPVIGETYALIKYEPVGKKGGWNDGWIVTAKDHVIYQGEEFTEEELLRMNNLWRVKGYYGTREFYQPDELDMQSPMPDARNVLLWKPDIVTDEKGEAEVEFFCSDINTSFVGVMEGTDGLGNLGTLQCEFRVLKP